MSKHSSDLTIQERNRLMQEKHLQRMYKDERAQRVREAFALLVERQCKKSPCQEAA